MTTFDGWEARLCGDAMAAPSEELMHFRTKGSKNGVRRYQQEDGTWTPLGLRERRQREGWGESKAERKASKQASKAERAVAKAERKSARAERRIERREAIKKAISTHREKKRLGDVSQLTDAELKKKIARVKMEQEYKEMTRSPILKTGEKLVSKYLEVKAERANRELAKQQNALENRRLDVDMMKAKADIVRSKETTKQSKQKTKTSKFDMKKARADAEKMEQDRKAGLKIERKKQFKEAKIKYLQEKNSRKPLSEKLFRQKTLEQMAKQRNAEYVAQQNAEKERQKSAQEWNRSEQERHKAEQKRLELELEKEKKRKP